MNAAQSDSLHLGYLLRSWFLLLVYDGLNLFCVENNIRELSSFDVARLGHFALPEHPGPVRNAAIESLEYLHNYPLKYFLLDESKIPLNRARNVLMDLAKMVGH